jgi:hypothetical protein
MIDVISEWWSLDWILIDDFICCILIDDHPSDFPYTNDIS